MGKKAKFKAIRRLAKEIPLIYSTSFKKVKYSGIELLKEGLTTVGDKVVNPMSKYSKLQRVAVPTNHNRKMKKLYNKMGHDGVKAYMRDATNYLKQYIKTEDAGNTQLAKEQ